MGGRSSSFGKKTGGGGVKPHLKFWMKMSI